VSRAVSTLSSPELGARQAVMVAVGAVLFYVSDVILAASRFWKPWEYRRISLAFYYGGQLLIALAASGFR
jgi:multisubunit Na+/H+ antiporter MnhB subunit